MAVTVKVARKGDVRINQAWKTQKMKGTTLKFVFPQTLGSHGDLTNKLGLQKIKKGDPRRPM